MFEFIGLFGRVILILLIARMVISMFSGGKRKPAAPPGPSASGGARWGGGVPAEKTVDKLVRDPQCGTYVAEHTSVTASHGGVSLHFCSAQCRDAYLASPRASAS